MFNLFIKQLKNNFLKFSKLVHIFIFFLKLEWLVLYLSRFNLIFIKAFPQSYQYKKNTFRKCKRDNVNFYIDISDYMQWYLYANIKDDSWLQVYRNVPKKSELIIFDIGSNIGAFSMKLAKKCIDNKQQFTVYAFEPNSTIFNLFKNNLSLNQVISKNILPFQIPMGDKNTEVNFINKKNNSGGSRVFKNKKELESNIETVKLQQISLDYFVEKNQIDHVDIIKIDVEGYEPIVLDGCINTIKKFKPLLYIEITPLWFKDIGRSSLELLNFLKSMGYEIFLDDENILKPIFDFERISNKEQFNILAKY